MAFVFEMRAESMPQVTTATGNGGVCHYTYGDFAPGQYVEAPVIVQTQESGNMNLSESSLAPQEAPPSQTMPTGPPSVTAPGRASAQ